MQTLAKVKKGGVVVDRVDLVDLVVEAVHVELQYANCSVSVKARISALRPSIIAEASSLASRALPVIRIFKP